MRRILSSTSTSINVSLSRSQHIFTRNIFIPLATNNSVEDPSKGKECTLYIKGFLAKGEHPEHFESWQRGHNILTKTHNWGTTAHGYFWKSGDLPGSLVPYATLLTGAYRLLSLRKLAFTPQGIALTAAAEAAVISGKFWYEFKKASDTAKDHGPNLAEHIQEISQKYSYVRVVAHSLGCALLLEALKVLPEKSKPHEIHFLAPAIDESLLSHNIAKEHAYVYHCAEDFALQTASTLFFQKKQVVGLSGPSNTYRGLTSVNVSDHFGFFVHTNYRHVLEKILVDHRKHYSPSSGLLEENGSQEVLDKEKEHEKGAKLEMEPSLAWSREFEHELSELERDSERDRRKGEEDKEKGLVLNKVEKAALNEVEKEDRYKKIKMDIQAIVDESVHKIGGALKDGAELLQVGKAFLHNLKGLVENRKDASNKK